LLYLLILVKKESKLLYRKLSVIAAATLLACTATAQVVPTEAEANKTALTQIGAYSAWSRGYTGAGSRIGFVDTGADLSHPDLKNVVLSKGYSGLKITDVNRGHGTGMISMAAGAKNGFGVQGVAYDASVMAYAGGGYGFLFFTDIANGIRWNADNRADVINLSLGTRETKAAFASYYTNIGNDVYVRKAGVKDPYSDLQLLPSLQYAAAKGSIIVMAAGNDGNPVPTSPANIAKMVDAKGNLLLGGRAVIVGAVDNNNKIASFSNRAGDICQNFSGGVCKDTVKIQDFFLVAPGGSLVWGANANYTSKTNATKTPIAQDIGTSASAAFVSGGVAVIKQAWPTLTPEQIVQVLLKTATDLGAPGVDAVYGNGLMNLDAATRPIGALTMAKITRTSTTAIAAGPTRLSSTGMVGSVLTKQSFSNSQVMQNAQAVDSVGRNFTVNMTAGMAPAMANYMPVTAYSGLSSTKLNYVDFGYTGLIGAMYTSNNMAGVRFGHELSKEYGGMYVGFESGTARETNAVLGTRGAGALALGNSQTSWNAVHLAKPVNNSSYTMFGSLALGTTAAQAASESMITGFDAIKTQSWTLGFSKAGFVDDKDAVSFQVTELPRITKGTATVTGVTGYSYANVTENGAEATPVVTTERVNLASSYRQYATSVSYTRNITALSQIKTNFTVQSDNAGTRLQPMMFVSYNSKF
jgi:Subtilase family